MAYRWEFTRHRHVLTVLKTTLWLECSSFMDAAGPIATEVWGIHRSVLYTNLVILKYTIHNKFVTERSFWSHDTDNERATGPRCSLNGLPVCARGAAARAARRRRDGTPLLHVARMPLGSWSLANCNLWWRIILYTMIVPETFTSLFSITECFQLGESSGGHMALTLAMRWRKRFFEPVHCPNGERSSTCAVAADDPEWLPDIKLQFLVYPVVSTYYKCTTILILFGLVYNLLF